MKEARIECITQEFPIRDLGLKMKQGDVAFVEESAARTSADLAYARRIGAVRVRYVERSRMTKKPSPSNPPPPNVRRIHQTRRTKTTSPVPTVDMEEIRRVAREEAKVGAREGVKEALKDFQGRPGIDQATLEAALRNVLPKITSTPRTTPAKPSTSPSPDEPVYIPKNIVSKDNSSELSTKSEEGDAGDIDAAAAALKSKKGTSRRRRKKTT